MFLSVLAIWLSTFLSAIVTSCFFSVWTGLQRNGLLPSQNSPVLIDLPLLPVWLSRLYFLPGYWPISVYLKYNWQNTIVPHQYSPSAGLWSQGLKHVKHTILLSYIHSLPFVFLSLSLSQTIFLQDVFILWVFTVNCSPLGNGYNPPTAVNRGGEMVANTDVHLNLAMSNMTPTI